MAENKVGYIYNQNDFPVIDSQGSRKPQTMINPQQIYK